MIRIGDFSKLSRVSIKTLRFYDESNLLKPVRVDPANGYRYYEYDQLSRLHRILALKDLGFSLEEIGQLLRDSLPLDQMRGMLKLRRSEIGQRVKEEMERLERVETLLVQIEQEDYMTKYDVVIKKVEAIQVASVRGVVATPPEQGPLWDELEPYLQKQHVRTTGPCFSLYHDDEYMEHDWDIEVCEQIHADLPETGRVNVRTLPAVESMACTVHQGPFTTISEAYSAIMKWIEANSYRIVGPCREVYVRPAGLSNPSGSVQVNQADPDTVTEIQYPVEKTA